MKVVIMPRRVSCTAVGGEPLASSSNIESHSACVSPPLLSLSAAELGKRSGRCRNSSGDLPGLCQELCCRGVRPRYPSLASHSDSRDAGSTAHYRPSTPELDRRGAPRRNTDKCAFANSHAVAAAQRFELRAEALLFFLSMGGGLAPLTSYCLLPVSPGVLTSWPIVGDVKPISIPPSCQLALGWGHAHPPLPAAALKTS